MFASGAVSQICQRQPENQPLDLTVEVSPAQLLLMGVWRIANLSFKEAHCANQFIKIETRGQQI